MNSDLDKVLMPTAKTGVAEQAEVHFLQPFELREALAALATPVCKNNNRG